MDGVLRTYVQAQKEWSLSKKNCHSVVNVVKK